MQLLNLLILLAGSVTPPEVFRLICRVAILWLIPVTGMSFDWFSSVQTPVLTSSVIHREI